MILSHKHVTGLATFALVLVCSFVSFAQEKIEISEEPPPVAANFPVLRKVGSAKVMTWAAKNQLISESGFVGVTVSQDEWINIKARFVTEGSSVVRPSAIDLDIYPSSTNRKYVDDRDFKIELDDKPFLSTTSKFQYANTDGHWIGAALKVSIPYADFVKISKAKSVRFQVGTTSFPLTEKGMQALQDLLKTIE